MQNEQEATLAKRKGYSVNKLGLVPVEVTAAFGPYSKGQVCGFAPSLVASLEEKGLVAPTGEAVDPDSTLDQDAVRSGNEARYYEAQALAGHQEAAQRVRSSGSGGYEPAAVDPRVMTTDTGPDPRVQDVRNNGVFEGIPEARRRPVREIEQRPQTSPLSPAGATLSGKPMAITGVTGAAGEPLSDPNGITDLNDNGAGDGEVHIPDGIEGAHANTRKALASEIAGRKVDTAPEADQIIADERAKRAGSAS